MIAKLATGDAHKNFLCSSTLKIRANSNIQIPRSKYFWNLEIGIWNLLRISEVMGP